MRSIKILIAGLIIMTIVGLTGCVSDSSDSDRTAQQHPLIQAIADQLTVKRDVELYASAKKEGKTVTVTVTLHNVGRKPITSVQSWLSYNPRQLKGKSIEATNSPFTLVAPYENQFDAVNGLVRIGRSSPEPVDEPRIDVAKITFETLTDDLIMLSFYDYQAYLTGHTSANMMVNSAPYNILKQPDFPAAVIR